MNETIYYTKAEVDLLLEKAKALYGLGLHTNIVYPTTLAPTDEGGYFLGAIGSYPNLIPAIDASGNSTTIEVTPNTLSVAFFDGTNWSQVVTEVSTGDVEKVSFDRNNNEISASQKIIADYLEGYTETTPGTNRLESVFSDLSGSLPVSAALVYMFKDTRTETETYGSIKLKIGTVGKIILEKYELSGTVLTRVAYQMLDTDLVVGENNITLTNNGVGGDMKTFTPTQFLGIRANPATLVARLSYLTPATPSNYQFGIVNTTGASFTQPTWRSDYRFGVQLLGEVEGITYDGKIKEIVESIIGNTGLDKVDNLYNFNVESVLSSLSKNIKPLIIIGLIGDSLLANAIGGTIPGVEVMLSERPMRLGQSNNVARRIYDLLSWNKPLWKRLDNSAWTKSGTWTNIHATNGTSFFEPPYADEAYYSSNTANSYVEIVVPAGQQHFALIVREGLNSGSLDFRLNGSPMPSVNGISSFNTNLSSAGHTGNPYKIIQFNNLPTTQDNIIRVIKDSTTSPVYIWGGFYWSGNTMVVMNTSHGGHNFSDLLSQHLNDEVVRNNFDAIIMETPQMNEMRLRNMTTSKNSFITVLDTIVPDKDILITSCNILGTDPSDGTPNYYVADATGSDWAFTQKKLNSEFKKIAYQYKLPFIDIFKLTEMKTLAKGGTLENGDAGIFFTHDGQHGNELGVGEWFNALKPILMKSILYTT